jgi:phosphatidylinositol-3,4,5-trisphosphate 3-phosphatase/dual-specificity protein phosphatase PTEN
MNVIRRKVSLNKKRLQKDGFDLDLSYITPRIIAMGYPSSGVESMYRNPRMAVKKFLDQAHDSHYKVYNLCIEREYDISFFYERVARFPFIDHQAPTLDLMGKFCKDASKWLAESPENVIAVHCKAGKGRAGLMVCCLLIHDKLCPDAEEAQRKFAMERTRDGEGVTIPSQKRYIFYYERILKFGMPTIPKITLVSVTVFTTKYKKSDKASVSVEVYHGQGGDEKETFCKLLKEIPAKNGDNKQDLTIDLNVEVCGDIKVVLWDKNVSKKKEIAHVWFNTAFIDNNTLVLSKVELDTAWKDGKKKQKFQPDFGLQLTFTGAENSSKNFPNKEPQQTTLNEGGSKQETEE